MNMYDSLAQFLFEPLWKEVIFMMNIVMVKRFFNINKVKVAN